MRGGTRRLAVVLAVASLLSAVVAVVAVPGAHADGPVSSFTYTSAPGDYIGGGRSESLAPPDATFTLQGTSGNVTVSAATATERWTITIAAPPESQLVPGAYSNAQRADLRSAGQPGIDVSSDSRGCNTTFGSFEVFAISADALGRLLTFDANFTQHCDSPTAPALVGVIRYQTSPTAPVTVSSSTPNAVLYQPVTLSAHVVTTTGVVSFMDGATVLGEATPDAQGVANLTVSSLSVGAHLLTASYGGSTSQPVTETVRDNTVSYWFSSGSGDHVGRGATESFARPGDTIFFSGTLGGASLSISSGGQNWQVLIAPAPGQNFAVGDFLDALRFPSAGHPEIDVVGGCDNDFGAFNVSDVAADGSGNLTEFDATFTQHCDSPSAPPLYGTIHYNGSTGPPPTTTTSSTTTTMPPTTTTTLAPATPLLISPGGADFGGQRVGTFGDPKVFTITNWGGAPAWVTRLSLAGADPYDFFGSTNCSKGGRPVVLRPGGGSCQAAAFFNPLQRGARSASFVVGDNSGQGLQAFPLSGVGTEGYLVAGARGEVGVFGDAVFHGDATNIHLSQPMISLATTPNGAGYWLLARDGGIFSYGNAGFHGSTGNIRLNKPIVAMSATRDGGGYRLVGSDGGIFAFGDARFYGSTGNIRLNKPVDGMAATINDRGYWLVASDGGIFAFGDAPFYGSAANAHLSSPVIQITPTPSGRGYWILTGDGHLYAYGDARSFGSAVGQQTAGMAATPDGRGYWEVTRQGRVFSFGDATAYGDISNLSVNDVVGIAATAPPLPPQLLSAAIPGGHPSANEAAVPAALPRPTAEPRSLLATVAPDRSRALTAGR